MKRRNEIPFLSYVGQILQVYCEKIKEKGEDACLGIACEACAVIGCFDGCGGIGSRRYEVFDAHTGAYVASRVTAEAAADWFLQNSESAGQGAGAGKAFSEERLAANIQKALNACKQAEPRTSGLKGSLTRDFPTTLAMAVAQPGGLSFFWAGDSRAYILDETGLHQMTMDDVDQQDAMANLSDDGPLKNVISASRSFVIHKREVTLKRPGIVLTCTDGCFGYLESPMAFELLLLQTLAEAATPVEWEQQLSAQIGGVAGDDYTLMALVLGFEDFFEMKQNLSGRTKEIQERYLKLRRDAAQSGAAQSMQNRSSKWNTEEKQTGLLAWWQEYRIEYENY